MADNEPGTLKNLKHQLDIETDNSNGKLMQYLEDGRTFLEEQVKDAGQEPLTNPTRREMQLIEDYAAGKYILKNTQGHSDKPFLAAKSDIKAHIRSSLQKVTDDGVAVGPDQFQLTTGTARIGRV
jgi:hypothetical protein